jgi:hypothetical protein
LPNLSRLPLQYSVAVRFSVRAKLIFIIQSVKSGEALVPYSGSCSPTES